MQVGKLSDNQSISTRLSPRNTKSGLIERKHNTLLQQILTEDNLNTALHWLRKSCRKQDHSDVWDYCRNGSWHKTALRQRLKKDIFSFQTVREVEIINEQGRREYREIRCAEDRLLICAISQVLTPIVSAAVLNGHS